MKYLSFLIIVFLFAQQSNGQLTKNKIGSVIDSLRNGYRPAQKIVFECFKMPDPFRISNKEVYISASVKQKKIILKPTIEPRLSLSMYSEWSLFTLLRNPVNGTDYIKSIGFVCREELKLDKITPIPVRFRLGSLEYVNWLERKPNAKKPD